MFFNNLLNIPELAKKAGCTIFVIPNNSKINIKNSIILEPQEKTTITVEQVRQITALLTVKQNSDRFIVIRPADTLTDESSNALLKNLEEPKENYHFVLITENPSKLLPTILSRASIYFLKSNSSLNSGISASEDIKKLAKQFIAASAKELPVLVETTTKKKENTRTYVLNILGTAIEILYKSYFKTNNQIFVKKLPKFLKAYENIERNGHIKLHLVADLL